MSENFLGIRCTSSRRWLDNQILSSDELIVARDEIAMNVKIWGAKGDGITDDSNAFQDAIDNNNHVYVPPGNYVINTPITLTANKTIVGDERAFSALIMNDNNVSQTLINIVGGPSLVKNLTFWNQGTNFNASIYINIVDTSYWVIDSCRTVISDANAAYFVKMRGTNSDCSFGRISNNVVRSMVSCIDASAVGGPNILRQLLIINNNFQVSPLFVPTKMMTFTNCQNSVIADNTFDPADDVYLVPLGIELITCLGMLFNNVFQQVTVKYTYLAFNKFEDDETSGVNLITDLATTFNVENKTSFQAVNTAPTNLASITGGFTGKRIFVQLNANTTVITTGAGNIRGNNGVNYASGVNDAMFAIYNGTNWMATFIDGTP